MDHPGRRVVGDEDQLEKSTVAGGTDGNDPALAAVVLLSNAEDVAPGVEDVGVRYAVLASTDSDLHSVKNARHPRIRQGYPDGLCRCARHLILGRAGVGLRRHPQLSHQAELLGLVDRPEAFRGPQADPQLVTSASGSAQPQRDRPAVKPRALGGRLSGWLRSSEWSVAGWGVVGLILISCPWQAGARLIV